MDQRILQIIQKHPELKSEFEEIYPELKDSEDERIRKWLIEMVEELRKANPTNAEHNENCSEAIAYLEKQKEQKSTVEKLREISTPADENWFEIQKKWENEDELKPAEWSDEDEEIMNAICDKLKGNHPLSVDLQKARCWILGIKDRILCKKEEKQEWSKDDEKLLDFWSDVIDRNDWRMDENFCKASREFINRLKSLWSHSHWKPSDEQMEALSDAYVEASTFKMGDILESLYNDLQKLL